MITEKFNPLEGIDTSKLCEVIGDIPGIGSAICTGDTTDVAPTTDQSTGDNPSESDNILSGTPLEGPNNSLKEQLVGTPLENLGIEPIFLILGVGVFFCIFIIGIILLLFGGSIIAYFGFSGSTDEVRPIIKQYEFPIPPPPPPPPVNFVMDNNLIES